MVEEGRLKVRVYTKGRLHAKAYIFDWSQPNPGNRGVAIVGSSNLTLSGVQDNTELNVVVHDNGNISGTGGNIAQLTSWFEELWEESQDFDEALMRELRNSWAVQLATPYDIYMKTLYALVRDRLEGGEVTALLGEDEITRSLADFQNVAVQQAIRMIQEYGGCFVADVVGLGKSFVGAAIVKFFERSERRRAVIVCPKPLEDMWQAYNQVYQLNAEIVPMSLLREGDQGVDLLNDVRYRDRDFVLIDESHNFRNPDSQRYRELQTYISADPDRKACLLTATPRNSAAMDVFHQVKLFHPDDRTNLPIDPPDLRAYFKAVENEKAPQGSRGGRIAELQDVLRYVMIRRTRRHVLRWFGYASDSGKPLSQMDDIAAEPYLAGYDGKRAYITVAGRHQFFPQRELQTLRYSIEETYAGLYDRLRGYLGKPSGSGKREERIAARSEPPGDELTYARYGLYNYVQRGRRTQAPYTDLRRAGAIYVD